MYQITRVIKLNKIKSHVITVVSAKHLQTVGINDIPKVVAADIRKLLRQKGFAVQDGFTSITTKCMICSEERSELKKGENKLYVNKTTGYFLCSKCNVHGDWNILERLIKKTKMEGSVKDYIEKKYEQFKTFQIDWEKIHKETTSIQDLSDIELLELFRLFEFPYHHEASKVLSEIRVSKDHTVLYFPLKNSLDSIVGYRKLQAGREEEVENHGLYTAGLFYCRAAKVNRTDQAILVPSIQDVLHLAASKIPGTFIWLNNCSLPPILLPTLEGYQKLCLWGDWENMRSVAEKLGEDRCRFVRPTDGLVTATEAASADLSLKTLVSEAKPAAHRSITTFAALRDDVYSELTNIDRVRGVKWRRFPALTRLLGGHRRGELTVLTGPTGCGKTTLCAEMSLDLAQQGVTTLWGSFEIRNFRLAKTMLQQFAGVPLEQNLQDFPKFADDFQKLPIYYLAFHGQQPIKVVMEAVEHARYMHDLAHVVVDNVQFMLGMEEREGDRYLRQDAVIAAFRTFATARHCHVTLVMHPRKERDTEDLSTSSIFGSAKASQEADNVLIIQDKRLTAVRGKKYLQVAKNRYSGDLGIVPLDFDKDSLSYQSKKKTKNKQDEPDKLLDECFEEYTLEDPNYSSQKTSKNQKHRNKPNNADTFLSDILNLNRTR